MRLLRCLTAALIVGMASPIIAVAATPPLEVLEKQLKELQAQIELLKQDKQEQDRRMREIEAAEKERAAKEAEALREQAKRGEEQERKTSILAEEMEAIKKRYILPETAELKSAYGLGPAASKVYQTQRGLAIGGYGEASAIFFVNDKDQPGKQRNFGDLLRFVTYIGYKFTDRIVLNSEIEFEHAKVGATTSSGSGDGEVEFANLDFLFTDWLNFRAGLLLIPMGFLNEMHEPPTFFGNIRPEVEQRIIPSTWRELGAGFHGTILPGLTYRTYAVNSLNAKGFNTANFRGARQSGNRALFEDVAWTGRLDYSPIPGALVGGSFFWGTTGQDQLFAGKKINPNFTLFEFHGQYQYRGLHLRALYAQGNLSDAAVLSADLKRSISRRLLGGYIEAAYNVLPLLWPETTMSLTPFIRFERLDTQADVPTGVTRVASNDLRVIASGIDFKPIPNVVFKFDYRAFNAAAGKVADEVNVGLGFAF
ncbi:MAG: hypothetical protein FIA90_11405 [candidate division NC10 bacterium]|nr:hypothetical protein [candidate division NC10 bacterium]